MVGLGEGRVKEATQVTCSGASWLMPTFSPENLGGGAVCEKAMWSLRGWGTTIFSAGFHPRLRNTKPRPMSYPDHLTPMPSGVPELE